MFRRLFLIGLCLFAPWTHAEESLPAPADTRAILIFGDSISAAYGFPLERGWVALLQARLVEQGRNEPVINASISGETTRGALARLPALLSRYNPAVVVIELGGNDGLRGISLAEMRRNLDALIRRAQAAEAAVVLLGMRLPPNYGKAYSEKFHSVYADLAKAYDLPWVSFFLAGVATEPTLMQSDGIHPAAAAQPILLEQVWPLLARMLGIMTP